MQIHAAHHSRNQMSQMRRRRIRPPRHGQGTRARQNFLWLQPLSRLRLHVAARTPSRTMSEMWRALHLAQAFQARRIPCLLQGRLRLGGAGERRRRRSARGNSRGRARQIVNFRQRNIPNASSSGAANSLSKRPMTPMATMNTIAASTEKFLHYLRYVRNASPRTIVNYKNDLDQFIAYVTPPGERAMALTAVDHLVIREFISHLYDQRMQKSSVARKLAALRSFFRFCVREHFTEQNPARLVARPKLPQRLPNVVSADEMNRLLDDMTPERTARARPKKSTNKSAPPSKSNRAWKNAPLVLARDRAILELLYASGLRVSELTGLDMTSINSREQMLHVLGKRRKERVVPYGAKAQQALEMYWPVRDEILRRVKPPAPVAAVFINS